MLSDTYQEGIVSRLGDCDISVLPILPEASAAGLNILRQNGKLFPDKDDQKWVTFPNLLSKLSKKDKLFPDEYPQIM